MKKNQNNKISWPILGSFLAIVISVILLISKSPKSTSIIGSKINTMLMLIEFERIEGIEQWEKELQKRFFLCYNFKWFLHCVLHALQFSVFRRNYGRK